MGPTGHARAAGVLMHRAHAAVQQAAHPVLPLAQHARGHHHVHERAERTAAAHVEPEGWSRMCETVLSGARLKHHLYRIRVFWVSSGYSAGYAFKSAEESAVVVM